MKPETKADAPAEILVVDDTPENITLLRDILGSRGFKVRPALNGHLALRAAEVKAPDLVLLDIMMPGIDGFETLARLRAVPGLADTPVLFISALDSPADKLRAFAAGAVDYIPKPFAAEEVLARVEAHLRLRSTALRLERQNAELLEAARLRDDVDAILRHDLRSPVATILSTTEVLADALPAEGAASTFAAHIRSAAWGMLEQIHSSLDLLRMERGVYEVRAAPLDLHAVFQATLAELAPTGPGRRAAVCVASDSAPPPWPVLGEALLCQVLLRNLLKNALEATPPDQPVEVSFSPPGHLRVRNRGGIPVEIRPRFFRKFVTAGKSRGAGLGAYSARLMAQAQAGDLVLEETPGDRTCLRLELPAASLPAAQPDSGKPGSSAGRRVLLMDDDPSQVAAVAATLAKAGFEVSAHHGIESAEKALRAGTFDAVLLDYELGGATAIDLAERLGSIAAGCRLIVLTAHDSPAIHDQCRQAGFTEVLQKPVAAAVLLAALNRSSADATDPELAALLPEFRRVREHDLGELRACLAAGEFPRARAIAHRMRGGFSLYGLPEAARTCEALERLSSSASPEGCAPHLDTLARTLASLPPAGQRPANPSDPRCPPN